MVAKKPSPRALAEPPLSNSGPLRRCFGLTPALGQGTVRAMGNFDRRNSMKMRRRKAQAKKKGREAAKRNAGAAAKAPAKKAVKKAPKA